MGVGEFIQSQRWTVVLLVFVAAAAPSLGAEEPIPASVVQVLFPIQDAQAVRIVILASEGGAEPCLDELEVYGPDRRDNLALASSGVLPSASSCLPGYAAHAIEHLNDGQYGNAHSWISAAKGSGWAQVTFPEARTVNRVVLSRDRLGQYTDRGATAFDVLVMNSESEWVKVQQYDLVVANPDAIPDPPPPPSLAAISTPHVPLDLSAARDNGELVTTFLHEEYAWLQAFGRADFHPGLSQPRYGMERPGPRHVGDDHLPLPPLKTVPDLDGRLDDLAWHEASRGVVRVASLDGFENSPLVVHAVWAGRHGDDLYLAIETGRLLSQHIAMVSGADWLGCGAVVFDGKALTFQSYARGGRPETRPIEGAFNTEGTTFEMRLPLSLFPTSEEEGLRIGLGMGGKYTSKLGRPVHFTPAPLAIAQDSPSEDGEFRVRLGLDDGASETRITGNLPGLEGGMPLKPGETVTLVAPAAKNDIGPEATAEILDANGTVYQLHLLRYAPATHVFDLAVSLADRLDAKGVDIANARAELDALRTRYDRWVNDIGASDAAQRQILFDLRMCKRQLLLSDPDLKSAGRVLFVKRHPFRPSHNYSVILDAPWNPGGGVCLLDMPWQDGALRPNLARVSMLFDSGSGVARTPMADFECNNIYFAHKPSPDGFFHIYRMCADGSGLEKITDGPFHDYWPCPLPDGGVAFISTRCKRRFLCWRPQAATLHRMDADGGNIRVLSYANLTEWAPSVMDDGRIIWTRSEYQDKAADFGHTLWTIRPDGTHPELVFGNTITKTNGYANGRYMPGTNEVACTLISHFGDLNGPIALLDLDQGRFNPDAISSVTPEVFWPGSPPSEECFRDPMPIAKDYILCSHAPGERFDLYIIDRYGNRELIYADPAISSMCPTPFLPRKRPPVLASVAPPVDEDRGEFFVSDVYRGLEPEVKAGEVAYLAVSVEVTHDLDSNPDGSYRSDHEPFQQFYASPSDVLTGPYGWPTYVVKQSLGVVPVEADGSAYFRAPSGKVLYFHLLDEHFNEVQRMRSVVQLQPGEQRSCIGCHEDRASVSDRGVMPAALRSGPRDIEPPPWGAEPFSFERVVQPVLDAKCVECHDETDSRDLDFSGRFDENNIPASYRTLISKGLVHYADWTWSNPDVCAKAPPRSLGTVKSRLFEIIENEHEGVTLTTPELRALKTWVDLNCPLWPDYIERSKREPAPPQYAWMQSIDAGHVAPAN